MSMENEEYNEIFKDWKTYVDSKDFLDKMEAPIRRMLNKHSDKRWDLHPVWDKIYKITNRESGVNYYSVMISNGSEDRIMFQDDSLGVTKSVMVKKSEAKQIYDIEVSNELDTSYTPREFMNFLLEGIDES